MVGSSYIFYNWIYTVARGHRDHIRLFEATGGNLSIAPHTRIGQVSSDTFRGLNMHTMEPDFSRHFAGIMNTTPAGLRRVAEICGERRVTLLANRIGSQLYRAISDIIDNGLTFTPFLALLTLILNFDFARTGPFVIKISNEHFEHNSRFTFSGHITDQHEPPTSNLRMGHVLQGSSISANACGWIAAYNAFVTIGQFVHPAEIIRFIERNNGLILDGRWGTSPRIYRPLFNRWRVRTTTILREPANLLTLETRARSARAAILCYWNRGGITNGAHYVTIRWNEDANNYTMWNGRVDEFYTIGDYLRNETGGFIAMITIL